MIKSKGSKYSMFFFALLAAVCLCAIAFFSLEAYVKASTRDSILSPEEVASADLDADCILVLGAGIWDDGTPKPMLEDRLATALELYKDSVSIRFLMSGDHSRADYDEVKAMKTYAIDHGVPSERIFMDHAGFSTYESLYRARDIFGVKKVVIVSQGYHLYRALYTARALGLEAWGVAADLRPYYGSDYYELREKAARVAYVFRCLLMPKPTYLGDPIPITGNGDVTND